MLAKSQTIDVLTHLGPDLIEVVLDEKDYMKDLRGSNQIRAIYSAARHEPEVTRVLFGHL